MKKIILLCTSAVIFPTAAFAQSTGTQDFDKKEEAIVITGTRAQQVGGVVAPDSSKAKAVLTQEYIARQSAGQTVLDTINAVPGVSFQNNDAYGSSGGTLNIRGFDSSRISLTFDGIPLNDSGNYAIFSNQQIDPELIDQVNVNLGTTDVDSPTASAVGGTVNLRTRLPRKEFGGQVVGSLGQFDFRRIFAVIDTGEIGPWGTRSYFSVSNAKNDNPFNNYGVVDKQQYNAKIYQPLGSNGDFISLAGNYNQNRNNFFGSLPLRTDRTQSATNLAPRTVGPNSTQRYPTSRDEREYDINYSCFTDTPQAGVADAPTPNTNDLASCGTEFDRRYNPSNTGNIKAQSRFTLTDALTLTIDPSFQYVKANGGGTTTPASPAREYGFDINPTGGRANCSTTPNSATVNCIGGYFGGAPYAGGRDLNGDGDILDTVTLLVPSQTRTKRYGVISGLRWAINDDHVLRFNYTLDHANHRQTGQVGLIDRNGEPFDVFPINDPLNTAAGVVLQKRDRQSYAILHQVSGEYRGEFFDDKLTVTAGLRAPFFTRKLDNRCFTSSAGGFVECSGGDPTLDATIATNNPYTFNPVTGAVTGFAPPGKRTLKYDALLPNVGVVFDITPRISAFVNVAKGLSVPSTDNLYNAFFFPEGTSQAKPKPETTVSFDGGLRYRSSKVQAQIAYWHTDFKNRSASAFDPELNATVFRNLGSVEKYGIDGSFAYSPIKQFTLYTFGSWNKSKIQDDIQIATLPVGVTCDTVTPGSPTALRSCAFTSGRPESGTPKYTYGFSALGSVGPFDLGITAKRTGPRYVFDNGAAVFRGDVDLPGVGGAEQVYDSKAAAYWLVNLDARVNARFIGLKSTYFQFNVYNLFDKFYVGGFGGGLNQSINATTGVYGAPPFVQIGAPRTVSGSINVTF
ncbi:TonB-dependent receptor domain-containing protein [Sphingomonas sp.]|uniref:TonB-dependent receptor n=1 Tax=Sphingomonas sp. TaxID=28214 RepID=UPI00286A5AA1|nr:TonB-dependent receptor [Sphingomonas sp.]